MRDVRRHSDLVSRLHKGIFQLDGRHLRKALIRLFPAPAHLHLRPVDLPADPDVYAHSRNCQDPVKVSKIAPRGKEVHTT